MKAWVLAILGACGVALFVPAAAALLAPPEALEQWMLLGDARLWLAIGMIFLLSLTILRLLLRHKPLPEETVVAPAVQRVDYLR